MSAELRSLADTARHAIVMVTELDALARRLKSIEGDMTGFPPPGSRPPEPHPGIVWHRAGEPLPRRPDPPPEVMAWDAAWAAAEKKRQARWDEVATSYQASAVRLSEYRDQLARACTRTSTLRSSEFREQLTLISKTPHRHQMHLTWAFESLKKSLTDLADWLDSSADEAEPHDTASTPDAEREYLRILQLLIDALGTANEETHFDWFKPLIGQLRRASETIGQPAPVGLAEAHIDDRDADNRQTVLSYTEPTFNRSQRIILAAYRCSPESGKWEQFGHLTGSLTDAQRRDLVHKLQMWQSHVRMLMPVAERRPPQTETAFSIAGPSAGGTYGEDQTIPDDKLLSPGKQADALGIAVDEDKVNRAKAAAKVRREARDAEMPLRAKKMPGKMGEYVHADDWARIVPWWKGRAAGDANSGEPSENEVAQRATATKAEKVKRHPDHHCEQCGRDFKRLRGSRRCPYCESVRIDELP